MCILALGGAACSDFRFGGRDDLVEEPVWVTEEFVQDPLPDVDILWVVDDTRSMAEEQEALVAAADEFSSALADAGVSWQLGVTTTDVVNEGAGELRGNPWILTPSADDPAAAIRAALAVGTEGSEPAAGLAAAWLALTEPLASGQNRGFRRPTAALHAIVVSDGDDHSSDIFEEASLGADSAAAFEAFLRDQELATNRSAVLSAIVGPAGKGCSGEGGDALPGDVYVAVAEATGGVTGSVCEADLSAVAAALGDTSVEWPRIYVLQAEPDPDSIRVAVDEVRADEGWTYQAEPPAVAFDEAPAPGAVISVRYAVAEP